MSKSEKNKNKSIKPVTAWDFDLELPSGKTVNVSIAQTMEKITKKVKVEVGAYVDEFTGKVVSVYQTVRDDQKRPITREIEVPGLRVKVQTKKETFDVRSCCKPPDIYLASVARKIAAKRICQIDDGIEPSKISPDEHGRPKPTIERKRYFDKDDRRVLRMAIISNGKRVSLKKRNKKDKKSKKERV